MRAGGRFGMILKTTVRASFLGTMCLLFVILWSVWAMSASAHDTAHPRAVDLLSPNEYYPLSLAGDPGWDYSAKLRADLNGDGREETIWVIFKSQGHGDEGPWQVYIEDDTGARTHVFARYLNHQAVHVFTGATQATVEGDWSELFILNYGSATVALYQVIYEAPGIFSTVELSQVYPLHWAMEER